MKELQSWYWQRDPHAEGENGNPALLNYSGHGVGVSWDGADEFDCALIAAAPRLIELLKYQFPDPEDKTPICVPPDWRARCLAVIAAIESKGNP